MCIKEFIQNSKKKKFNCILKEKNSLFKIISTHDFGLNVFSIGINEWDKRHPNIITFLHTTRNSH